MLTRWSKHALLQPGLNYQPSPRLRRCKPAPVTVQKQPTAAAASATKPERRLVRVLDQHPEHERTASSRVEIHFPVPLYSQQRISPPQTPYARSLQSGESHSISWLWWMLGILAVALVVWFLFFRPQPTPVPTSEAPTEATAAGAEGNAAVAGGEGAASAPPATDMGSAPGHRCRSRQRPQLQPVSLGRREAGGNGARPD